MPPLDHDRCYAAAASRDARFDGWFVTAVRTTGIYCRPSCPAITPKQENVEFHPTAAAAQQRGFRACKRCRPDASPGSPEWNVRQDLAARAMRLIADGVVDRDGVAGLARRLGYSERHLHRLLVAEVGAGPLAIARAQRAQTARLLIETTDLRLTDVAFAAGFGSVRQFNDTVREVFADSPGALRAAAAGRGHGPPPADPGGARIRLRLPARTPFAWDELLDFLAVRAVPGLEAVVIDETGERRLRRVVSTPDGHALVTVGPAAATGAEAFVEAEVTCADWSGLGVVVQRLRRLLDLDADPVAVDGQLAADPLLGPLVARRPGLRSPGSVDPFETAVRAVVGQQVSVAAARTVAGRLVASLGDRLDPGDGSRTDDDRTCDDRVPADSLVSAGGEPGHAFPSPERLADAPDDALPVPAARRDTLRRLAAAIGSGDVVLDAGADPEEARRSLLAIRGVGPWTADYVLMRALGDPDRFLPTDLGIVRSAERLGVARRDLERTADRWCPWRSYATHHLWRTDPDGPTTAVDATAAAEPAVAETPRPDRPSGRLDLLETT